MNNEELIEKCLLILRGYHLPAQTLGKEETYCDGSRKNFLVEAIPIISAEAEMRGWRKGNEYKQKRLDIKLQRARAEARKQEGERILEIIRDWDKWTDEKGGEEKWQRKYGTDTTNLISVIEQALKEGEQGEG